MSAKLADAAARETARRNLESSIIVEAGAGTGKTTLLIDRIIFLLLGGGLDIARLVALTFTEKAAAEIKFRLADRLHALAALLRGERLKEPDEAAERCLGELSSHFARSAEERNRLAEAALRALERAQIGTIHSFCSHLLRLYPLEAGVDPEFRVDADESALEELFESEWALWLDSELGERAPHGALWRRVLGTASLEDVRSLAWGLVRPRVDLGRVLSGPSTARALRCWADRAGRFPEGQPKPTGKILDFLSWAARRLRAAADSIEGRVIPVESPPCAGIPKWPKKWEAMGRRDYERLAKIAKELRPDCEPLFAEVVALLAPFVESLRRSYRRRGWITFEGLLVGARDLLRDVPRVRAELKRRFGAVLIDEFQDTDPLQGEIFFFLGEAEGAEAGDWRQVRLAPGKLFVVGDPKQSIYRFRGADIAAMQSFTARLEEQGARRCALQTNFRSLPGIVAVVNEVFQAVMRPLAGLQPDYLPILPAPGGEKTEAGVEWIQIVPPESDPDRKVRASESRRCEAEWIARWISEHRGRHLLREIAIVLRGTSDLVTYLDALKRAEIPYVVDGEKYFFETQEVSDFLNLLRSIDDPGDRISLAGLLRSPLAALDDRELYDLSRERRLDYRKKAPGLEPLFEKLRRFHTLAGVAPLGELLRAVVRDTELLELCSLAYHHQQTVSNILKFVRLGAEASDRGATLKEFIAFVARSKKDLREEGESPLADDDFDAVRVLSIHKAKGLEYPVVILPNLSGTTAGGASKDAVRAAWSDGAAGLRLLSAGVSSAARVLMDEEEVERQREEEVRVLYVAMTRPRERLLLLGSGQWRRHSFSAMLDRAGCLPRRSLTLGSGEDGVPARASRRRNVIRLPGAREAAAAWERRRKARESAESKTLFTHPSLAADPRPPRNIKSIKPKGPDPALLGSLCHEVLERWDYKRRRPIDPAAGESLKDLLARRSKAILNDVPGAEAEKIRREARDLLAHFLKSETAAFLAGVEILGRELPILFERDGQVVRGAIDLLYRENGELTIADYKTDRVSAKDRLVREKKYRRQGSLYVGAVEQAIGVRGVKFQVLFLRAA